MPAFAKGVIDRWTAATGISTGPVFRPVNRGGKVWGESLSETAIWQTVKGYARQCGLPNLAPHDLRRTFAKPCHKGHAPLEQIQLSLGHACLVTTEKYLGTRQDLTDASCDRIGIRLHAT